MNKQKNILAIHDISCFGKCSLTVALPIISACSHRCTILPTAVLSTHTGGFKDYTFHDMTGEIKSIAKHFKAENISFDAIYTGYLGSVKQVDLVIEIIEMLKNDNTKIIVDPVLGDNGVLYQGFDDNFAKEMKKLTKKAHYIIPNYTEACLLLGEKYKENPSKELLSSALLKLQQETNASVILTGITEGNHLGAYVFDKDTKTATYCYAEKVKGFFHGTGDVFGSVFTSFIMLDKSLVEATEIACKFTSKCVETTKAENTDLRYGVNFEKNLIDLINLIK